jgi:hypothetical protein
VLYGLKTEISDVMQINLSIVSKRRTGMNIDDATRTVKLATNFRVGDYLDAIAQVPPNQAKIAEGIHRRFVERYIEGSQ